MSELMAQLVALVVERPDDTDDELVARLVAAGVEESTAERLIAFVPMGLQHEYLASRGARLPVAYELHDPDSSQRWRFPLGDEPLYVQAREYARQRGFDDPHVLLVAARSAEAAVLRDLGGDPSTVVFIEPVLLRLAPPQGPRRRPWWQRWWGGAG